MLTQKQTSTALFTLCLGTFLALLGCSVITSFIIAFVIGISLLGISYLKKSLISATTVLDTDSNCAVTVKRTEQKSAIPEPSFLGKASLTPIKSTPSGVTPNIEAVKQVLNFTKSSNSTITTTPVKQLNNSVIRLKNSHYGASAWPLNSTPIEKKPVLVEQNYHMNMMKAINNVQQVSPYSVKRSAVDKECSPPVVSQHKKPKTLPLLKEGRSLRHVPTVYVVHKKAENILKNKGNKRVLENTENVNDSKRRNKEDGEVEKPQKRKLLSIVHITGKKHKVPSINSPTKYSRNTDLVVTNDDLKEDRRRNEERVRKLLAHKDDETTKPSIKPAKEPVASSANINSTSSNKAEVTKTVSLPPSDKENTAPAAAAPTLAAAPATVELSSQTPSVETPKSLPKSGALDAPISTDSKVVKSLFGTSDSDPKPGFTFGTVKSEPPAAAQPTANQTEVKPSLNFGAPLDPPLNSLSSKGDEPKKTSSTISFGGLTSSVASSSDSGAAKPTISFGGLSSSTASTAPSFSFGGTSTAPTNPAPTPALTTQPPVASSTFSFGGSAPAPAPTPQPTSQSSGSKLPSFAAAMSAPTATAAPETKPSFSFGSAAPSTAPSTGFSFGAKTSSTVPALGSTAPPAAPPAAPAPGTGFSFGSSTTPAPSLSGAGNTAAPAASGGFSFGSLNSATTATANVAPPASTAAPAASTGFSFGSAAPTATSSAPSTGFSFGGAPATSTTSTGGPSLFGAPSNTSAAPATGFSFGSTPAPAAPPAAPPAATTGFSFGSSSTAASTPAFGATSTTASSNGGFSFGKTASTATSAAPAFGASTTTPSAGGFSFGGAAPSAAPTFGAAPSASQSGSVFGSTSSAPSFGSSAAPAFGATSASTAPSFGAPSFGSNSAGSVFGAGSTTTTSSAGVFGTPTSSATPSFGFGGQPQANPTPPAPASTGFNFGGATTSTPQQPAGGGFSFGAPAPAAPTAGGFNFGGAPPSAPTTGSPAPANLFNNAAPAPAAGRRIATPRRRKPR